MENMEKTNKKSRLEGKLEYALNLYQQRERRAVPVYMWVTIMSIVLWLIHAQPHEQSERETREKYRLGV